MSKVLLADGVEWRPGMVVWSYFGGEVDTVGFSAAEREMFDEKGRTIKLFGLTSPANDDYGDVKFYYSTPDGGKKQAIKNMRKTLDIYQKRIQEFEQSKNQDWFKDIKWIGLELFLDQSV